MRADSRKELVAPADGYRESAGSWADLRRECKRRGMRAPVLAVGAARWDCTEVVDLVLRGYDRYRVDRFIDRLLRQR